MSFTSIFQQIGQRVQDLWKPAPQERYGHWQDTFGNPVGRVILYVDGHTIKFDYQHWVQLGTPTITTEKTKQGIISRATIRPPRVLDMSFYAQCNTLPLSTEQLLTYVLEHANFDQFPTEVYANLAHKLKDKDYKPKDGLDALLAQGVNPLDAQLLLNHFSEQIQVNPAAASKNTVYHLKTTGGRKIVKFVARKPEADIECLVNYHFSRHLLLRKYVPKSNQTVPTTINIGDTLSYMLVQEDVQSPETDVVDRVLTHGSPQELEAYLTYWMKTLAQIHVYGTKLMDEVENHHNALRFAKGKDHERLERSGLVFDPVLRMDIIAEEVESRGEFIHQDIRPENRVGTYAIDWGHAGRGNGLVDVARILVDHRAQRFGPFTETDYQRYLTIYLEKKAQISGRQHPLTRQEKAHALQEFKKISLLYAQSQGPYLLCRGNLTPSDQQSIAFMSHHATLIERDLAHAKHVYFPSLGVADNKRA